MRAQRIHDSGDDGNCDSNSANNSDVEDDNDDCGTQQRNQMQHQHNSPVTKTTRFGTTPMRATAPPFMPKSQHQPAAHTVLQRSPTYERCVHSLGFTQKAATKTNEATTTADLHRSPRSNAIASRHQPACSSSHPAVSSEEAIKTK